MGVRDAALTGLPVITFLHHVQRHASERLLVIGDGATIHRRAAVTEFLGSGAECGIAVVPLPSYAPDLNPWDAGG